MSGIHHGIQRAYGGPEYLHVGTPGPPELTRRGPKAHEFRVGEDGRRAVSQLEIQGSAQGDDHIRILHGLTPHGRYECRVIFRDEKATLTGVDVEAVKCFQESQEGVPGGPCAPQ